MKSIQIFIAGFVLLCTQTFSQMADQTTHNQMADSITGLFNEGKFKEIYALTTSDFKTSIQEKDVLNVLDNGISKPFGKIKKTLMLREDTGYFAYVMHFAGSKVQMNLGVSEQREVALLQFLPYRDISLAKREKYPSDNKKQNEMDRFIDSLVKGFMQSPQNCGLSIAITYNGADQFYNYGEVKRDSKQLPASTTIYEIGSLTKTFCGLLLAKAVEEKKIMLEDDIRNYLPSKYPALAYNRTPVRIKHLANHTSGLPRIPEDLTTQPGYDPLNPYKHYTKQMVFEYLKIVKLKSEPGKECEYSNLGMALLGIILEDLYHKPFEELVREKILAPNEMNNTGITLPADQFRSLAEGYNDEGLPTPYWDLGGLVAAGALRSCTQDMLSYLNYNMQEKDPVTQIAHQATFKGRQHVGLAWFIKNTKQNNTLIWHNGGTFGFSAFSGFIKEKACSVILLSNSATNIDYLGIGILDYLQR